jgi:hypothetical protein
VSAGFQTLRMNSFRVAPQLSSIPASALPAFLRRGEADAAQCLVTSRPAVLRHGMVRLVEGCRWHRPDDCQFGEMVGGWQEKLLTDRSGVW